MGDVTDQTRYWRANARRYDRAVFLFNRQFAAMAAAVADDLKGRHHVLEVGAGTGLVTVALSGAVDRLTATDTSSQKGRRARWPSWDFPSLPGFDRRHCGTRSKAKASSCSASRFSLACYRCSM